MIGYEREALRITPDGCLAKTPHPKALGSALTHPYISTDFAEAQLEFITPPCRSFEDATYFLGGLHKEASLATSNELLWPLSMPAILPGDIEIATYGLSSKAQEKYLYRLGLSKRYPIEMQLISGLHYNISFDDEFWNKLYCDSKSQKPLQEFKNQMQMKACRNFLSLGWLLSYLFGASPDSDVSTSVRMSHKGYFSKSQSGLHISYDSFEAYSRTLCEASTTPNRAYKKFGTSQLNANHLQIPAEHYSRIRPKGSVDYLEVRSLDLNPFSPVGIELPQAKFTKKFVEYCITADEQNDIHGGENQNRVALFGRDPNLLLLQHGKEVPFKHLLEPLLEQLDTSQEPLSERVWRESKGDMISFGLLLAKKYAALYKDLPRNEELSRLALTSLQEQKMLDYEGLELSTKLVIEEALSRNITVDIIDRSDNIIALTKNGHTEYIKQATKTSKDTYICAELMGNKQVTKKLLAEQGINVPEGKFFTSKEEALRFELQGKVILKPTHANYGLGISVINSQEELPQAVEEAFAHSDTILIEEFFPGEEVRVLVIDQKVIGCIKREPANVIGDGCRSVSELIEEKNTLKLPEYPIVSPPNKKVLAKGEKLYLRENSNVSTGGDPIATTLPEKFTNVALVAASTLGATICGVDMLISGDDYVVIELNYNPAIWMHAYPYKGEPAPVAAAVVDFVMASSTK